jgi:hypothetical protein
MTDTFRCLRPQLRDLVSPSAEAQHPKSSAIHKNPGRLPHLSGVKRKRREFIAVFGGAAAWPVAANRQQLRQRLRIGLLLLTVSRKVLQKLGWTEGSNIAMEYRFTEGDPGKVQQFATQLAKLRPDAILVGGTDSVKVAKPTSRHIGVLGSLARAYRQFAVAARDCNAHARVRVSLPVRPGSN